MIVIDSSALMAIALNEPPAEACRAAIDRHAELLISAASLTEVLIVAMRRRISDEIEELIEGLELSIVAVSVEDARAAARAYRTWGKGFHPAALNFGDCLAYGLARKNGCPLLYVGNDFARTDIEAAI